MFYESNDTILPTGYAGFIRSNFVPCFLDKCESYNSMIYGDGRDIRDKLYTIDATRIENGSEWKADENLDTEIVKTIGWCLETYSD